MTADSQTCPSCGARVPLEADRCDLCGTPVETSGEASEEPTDDSVDADASTEGAESVESEAPSDAASASSGAEDRPTVFCNQCGWENPPGARYCSRCGERLQDLSETAPVGTRRVSADLPTGSASDAPTDAEENDASDEPGEDEPGEDEPERDEQAAMGGQIALVVGGALVLVLGLFFVTQWSAQYEWGGDSGSTASSAQVGAGGSGAGGSSSSSARSSGDRRPMSGPGQGGSRREEPTDLRVVLDQTADSLAGSVAGRIDSLQTRIDQASGAEKRQLQTELVNLFIGARHAAQAYETVANQRPDDLDARTRMGEAYLLTNEPMRGIKAINAVLDEDSTFVPARFQKGLALLQINRLDQATKQFEMVKQYAEDGSPFSQQAERAIKVIKQQRSQSTSGGSTPAPGTDR
ncbi:MAG: zinc ribbon domain-containing protein [Bacteroidetes bacterium QH_2_63_10]|nr:MAG: zinc ribbon domain-containing protein [Bacteroidetes bacterium QH_2_63_10]